MDSKSDSGSVVVRRPIDSGIDEVSPIVEGYFDTPAHTHAHAHTGAGSARGVGGGIKWLLPNLLPSLNKHDTGSGLGSARHAAGPPQSPAASRSGVESHTHTHTRRAELQAAWSHALPQWKFHMDHAAAPQNVLQLARQGAPSNFRGVVWYRGIGNRVHADVALFRACVRRSRVDEVPPRPDTPEDDGAFATPLMRDLDVIHVSSRSEESEHAEFRVQQDSHDEVHAAPHAHSSHTAYAAPLVHSSASDEVRPWQRAAEPSPQLLAPGADASAGASSHTERTLIGTPPDTATPTRASSSTDMGVPTPSNSSSRNLLSARRRSARPALSFATIATASEPANDGPQSARTHAVSQPFPATPESKDDRAVSASSPGRAPASTRSERALEQGTLNVAHEPSPRAGAAHPASSSPTTSTPTTKKFRDFDVRAPGAFLTPLSKYEQTSKAVHSTRAAPPSVPVETAEERTISLIERDLARSFQHLAFFRNGSEEHRQLLRVLAAYAQFRPDHGYHQFMAPLAAMLTLVIGPLGIVSDTAPPHSEPMPPPEPELSGSSSSCDALGGAAATGEHLPHSDSCRSGAANASESDAMVFIPSSWRRAGQEPVTAPAATSTRSLTRTPSAATTVAVLSVAAVRDTFAPFVPKAPADALVFIALCNILLRAPLRWYASENERRITEWMALYENVLKRNISRETFDALKAAGLVQGPNCHLYIEEWFSTLFARAFDMETAALLWDRILVGGPEEVVIIAVGIMMHADRHLLHLVDATGNLDLAQACILLKHAGAAVPRDRRELLKTLDEVQISTDEVQAIRSLELRD